MHTNREDPIGVSIAIATADGTMDGWLVAPDSPRGAVIVCPEIFGVTAQTRATPTTFAKAGYATLAINLTYRRAPNLELAHDDEGRTRGLALFHELRRETVVSDLQCTVAFLASRFPAAKIAVVGFSSGGHVAYLAGCTTDVRLAVCFYGGWITDEDLPLGRPTATIALTPGMKARDVRLLYIVGGRDFLVTEECRETIARALRESGVRHELVVYPEAEHAFLLRDVAATTDALRRTIAALDDALAHP